MLLNVYLLAYLLTYLLTMTLTYETDLDRVNVNELGQFYFIRNLLLGHMHKHTSSQLTDYSTRPLSWSVKCRYAGTVQILTGHVTSRWGTVIAINQIYFE